MKTKWKIVTIMEMDEQGLISVRVLDPIQLDPERDDEEEEREN